MKDVLHLFLLTCTLLILIIIKACVHENSSEEYVEQSTIAAAGTHQASDVEIEEQVDTTELDLLKTGQEGVEALSGVLKGYNKHSKLGCLYLDKDMLAAGVTKPLGDKAHKGLCTDIKHGIGAPISFYTLDIDSAYPSIPEEGMMIRVVGEWANEPYEDFKDTQILYVKSYEPFF